MANMILPPDEVLVSAVDDHAAREKQVVTVRTKLSTQLGELQAGCKKDLRSVISPEQADNYEKFHARTKQRIVDLTSVTQQTTESLNLEDKMRRQIAGEARRFTAQLGVDATKISQVQKRYLAAARTAVEDATNSHDVAPYVAVSADEVPTVEHNPWQWRNAPFSGQWGSQASFGTRGTRWVWHHENRLSGELGCWSSMNISGADDSDTTYTDAYSELQFWFQMPAAGLVEVWLYLQAIDTPFGGCLYDEWGFSDANIQELSRPYLWVLSPFGSPRYGTLLDYRRGEVEGCWSGSIATAGAYRYAHLFSFDSYAAGQWVNCGVGIHDFDYFWVNDMTCHTHTTGRWFLKNVAVRSTGAP